MTELFLRKGTHMAGRKDFKHRKATFTKKVKVAFKMRFTTKRL